jgi:hypothetical protein
MYFLPYRMVLLTRRCLSLLKVFTQSNSFTYQHHQMRLDAFMPVYKSYEQRGNKGDAWFGKQVRLSALKARGIWVQMLLAIKHSVTLWQ